MPSNTKKSTATKKSSTVKNKKLGKGLDAIFGGDISALIDDIEKNTPETKHINISLDEIRPNPYQPRKLFDEEKLEELAISIKEHGIFQPVILKSSIQGYEIVAGERRCRAAKKAGLSTVPAIIVDFTDDQMMEIALLENIQREDLNSIEEAKAYLEDEYLRDHLMTICEALLSLDTSDALAVFGRPDNMKLRSSMTLFAQASDNDIFQKVLEKYFEGKMDGRTVKMLQK